MGFFTRSQWLNRGDFSCFFQDLAWSPCSNEFMVIVGMLPAEVNLYNGTTGRSAAAVFDMSDGFHLVKWRVVLGRTPVCRKHPNEAVKRGRNTPRTR